MSLIFLIVDRLTYLMILQLRIFEVIHPFEKDLVLLTPESIISFS